MLQIHALRDLKQESSTPATQKNNISNQHAVYQRPFTKCNFKFELPIEITVKGGEGRGRERVNLRKILFFEQRKREGAKGGEGGLECSVRSYEGCAVSIS